ncbi:hypothetical protein Syun_019683 [Stephania yunnanensis]|uniref:Uncharacterized protein n=1 Tax=Stephania yunnanensis TaxID=152371 RepID=A0AAP0NZM7_9MAGN
MNPHPYNSFTLNLKLPFSTCRYGGNMSSAKATLESDTHVSEQALNGDFAVK